MRNADYPLFFCGQRPPALRSAAKLDDLSTRRMRGDLPSHSVVLFGTNTMSLNPITDNPAFIVMDCGQTARRRFAVLAGDARAGITPLVRAGIFLLQTRIVRDRPRFIWALVCCSIYGTISASLLCLDREALPLELSASLLARGARRRSRVNRALWFAD